MNTHQKRRDQDEVVRSTNRWLGSSHGDTRHSTGNVVGDTVTALGGGSRTPGSSGHRFVNYANVEPLCYTPETNIKQY